MKMFKHFKAVVALSLVLVMALLMPAQVFGESNKGKYLSEVYIAYGKEYTEARDTLEEKGYTVIRWDLNYGGNNCVLLGYKTTNDIREAITDLAVMNMRGDYSVEDYKTLLKSQKTQIAEFLTEFMAVIQEYRANLKAGKEKATYVHDLLNNYKDDDTGMKMGDLLNSETLQDKVGIAQSIESENPDKLPDLVTILLQGNAQVIKSIEILLSMATDTADNSWLDRFAESDYDALLDAVEDERPELNTESKRVQYLDNLYGEVAGALGADADVLRNKLSDYEAMDLHVDSATEEDVKNTFGDIKNDPEAAARYNDWLTIGSIHDGLKYYEGGNYQAGELLAFFLEENDPEDAEIFIPMAAALSEGQRSGLPFVSFERLMSYAFTNDEGWKTFAQQSKTAFDGLAEVSVYQNIDRDLYKEDGSVALTGAARRADNTADGTTGGLDDRMDAISTITALSWAAVIGSTFVTLGSISYAYKKAMAATGNSLFIYEGNHWEKDFVSALFHEKDYKAYMADESNFKWLNGDLHKKYLSQARYGVKLSRILGIVTLALAVFSTVMTVIDSRRDKNFEQLPIPKYMVDNYTDADGGSYALNYKAVECNREEFFGKDYTVQTGNCADLLADEGKQWLVLYATKNSKAGKPLTPDIEGSEINKAPDGYDGCMHLFGEKGAVNTIGGAFRNYSTLSQTWQLLTGEKAVYIFTKASNDVKTYDESTGNMTASAIGSGNSALFGIGGLVVGAIIGAVGAIFIGKGKKKKENAYGNV